MNMQTLSDAVPLDNILFGPECDGAFTGLSTTANIGSFTAHQKPALAWVQIDAFWAHRVVGEQAGWAGLLDPASHLTTQLVAEHRPMDEFLRSIKKLPGEASPIRVLPSLSSGYLKVKLGATSERYRPKPAAYEAYLRGRHHMYLFTPAGMELAREYSEQASVWTNDELRQIVATADSSRVFPSRPRTWTRATATPIFHDILDMFTHLVAESLFRTSPH